MILVHGFSDQSMSWFLAARDLLSGYHIVAVDLPGHGGSEPWKKEKLTIGEMASELDKVIKGLGLRGAALVGHSMGGMVAQEYAVEHPRDLSVVFLCCTASGGALLSETAFNLEGMKKAIQEDGIVRALSADPYSAFAEGFDDPLVQEYLEMEFSTDGATAVKCLDAIKEWKLDYGRAKVVEGRVVVLCGDRDRITPMSFAPDLTRAFPRSRLETIKGAGHMVFLERPKEFEASLERNLSS